jgi:hypothetical protein
VSDLRLCIVAAILHIGIRVEEFNIGFMNVGKLEVIPFTLLVSWGGMRLNLVCTSATIWPIAPAADDR